MAGTKNGPMIDVLGLRPSSTCSARLGIYELIVINKSNGPFNNSVPSFDCTIDGARSKTLCVSRPKVQTAPVWFALPQIRL